MTSLRWFLWTVSGALLLLVLQFFVFRIPAVYDLCLRTYLYDNGWWVERPAKILVLGSSNAMNDIMPERIIALNRLAPGDMLNLGMNGCTPLEARVTLEKQVRRFGAPQAVYLVCAPALLSEGAYVKKDYEKILLSWSQWRALEAEKVSNSYFFPLNIFWKACKFSPWHNFRDYHFQLDQTRKAGGFQPNPQIPYSEELKPGYEPRCDANFGLAERQMQEMKRIADWCAARQVEFFLVLAPVHPVLFKEFNTRREQLQPIVDWLNRELGGARIIGSMNPERYGLQRDDFINLDHLSLTGAGKYSAAEFGDLAAHRRIEKRPLRHFTEY